MEEIDKASWTLIQHDDAAAFKLSERSPWLPALAAEDLPGGRTQVINLRWTQRIDRHRIDSVQDSTNERDPDNENILKPIGNFYDPNGSEEDYKVPLESDIKLDNGIEDPESPERWNVSAAPHVPGLIRPTRNSKRKTEKELVTVNAMETWRSKGIKNNQDRMCHYVSPGALCSLMERFI